MGVEPTSPGPQPGALTTELSPDIDPFGPGQSLPGSPIYGIRCSSSSFSARAKIAEGGTPSEAESFQTVLRVALFEARSMCPR